MSNVGSAYVEIEARPKPGFENDAEKAITPGVTNVAKSAAKAFAAAFVVTKAFDFAGDAFAAAEESNKIAAQTENVIKSTGAAAGVTAEQVDKLSTAISRRTGVDDEAIASAQNLLLTFTGIKNGAGENEKIFDRTTQAAVDMAAALGTDASSAAAQLGKALNDPVAGAAKLARAGVVLSDAQKEQIKTFVEAGNTAAAQGVILDEVAKKFGGSAEAQATATDKMHVAVGNAQEAIGNLLIPVIGVLTNALLVVVPVIEDTVNWLGEHKAIALTLAAALGTIVSALVAYTTATKIASAVESVRTAATKTAEAASKAWAGAQKAAAAAQWALNAAMNANPIALVVIAIAALVAGVILAYKHFEPFRNIVDAVGRALLKFGETVAKLPGIVLDAVSGAGSWLLDVGEEILGGLVDGFLVGLNVVKFFYVDLPLKILGYVADAASWLLDVGETVIGGLVTGFEAALDVVKFFYVDLPLKILEYVGDAALWLVEKGSDVMAGLLDGIVDGATAVFDWLGNLGSTVLDKIGDFLVLAAGKGKDLLVGLLNGIHDGEMALIDWALRLLGNIWTWIGDAVEGGLKIGKDLVEGIVRGIESIAGRIKDAIMHSLPSASEILDAITPSRAGWLDRFNPARGVSDNSSQIGERTTIAAGTVNGVAMGNATLEVTVAPPTWLANYYGPIGTPAPGARPAGNDARRGASGYALDGGGSNVPVAGPTITVDARVMVAGNVYGVDDLDRWADERDRKLAARLVAGTWR